jgi:hypothetical protein
MIEELHQKNKNWVFFSLIENQKQNHLHDLSISLTIENNDDGLDDLKNKNEILELCLFL